MGESERMKKETYEKIFITSFIIMFACIVPMLFIDSETLINNDLFIIPALVGLLCCIICIACARNPFRKEYNGELLKGE